MGKSDPHVFSSYLGMLGGNKKYSKVAFLGFTGPSDFTNSISHGVGHYFDMQLDNWFINDDEWDIGENYDLVVCTRCAYFSKDPSAFLKKCLDIVVPGGLILVDWGVGDHWRFNDYKVGWVKNDEHEFAYEEENFLWSAIWHDSFIDRPAYKQFEEYVKKFGYDDVKKAIFEEVPSVLDLGEQHQWSLGLGITYELLTLWEDLPQLYMIFLIQKQTEAFLNE
tara:strand:- start:4211 stop:4876 length:666 start_codon:yes stop_codon:yes gene_type:complete